MELPLRVDRRVRVLLVALALGGVGWLVYANRWRIGRHAVEIADPVVRKWASREVARLSDGSYRLTASTIIVNEAERSVRIDTVIITTDLAVNARRALPLPAMTLRFRNCALRGIDLTRLTAGSGLHIASAGCDSVALAAEVPRPTTAKSTADDGGAFLSLQGDLDLPREIPFIRVDTVAFPQVAVAVGLTGRAGRRMAVGFDRLAVRLDSLHYDPRQKRDARRTLFSRDVTVSLEGFEGSREAANRLALRRLTAGLANGTLRLDGFEYEPLPGPFADSLGFTSLSVGRLALDDVNWRGFLSTGDIAVGRMTVDSVTVSVSPSGSKSARAEAVPMVRPLRPPLAVTLRTIGRAVRLDTLALSNVKLVQPELSSEFRTTTTLDTMLVANVAFSDDPALWNGPYPIGRVTVDARGVLRRNTSGERVALRSLLVDLPARSARAADLKVGPEGSDADFLRRTRWRSDRVTLAADSVTITGADWNSYLLRDAYRIRRATVKGLAFDIYSDKGKPSRGGRESHRTPQQSVQATGLDVTIDTISLAGRMTYRERLAEASRPGAMVWEGVRATMLNFSTDPARQSDSTPMRLVADARLMGRGTFHVDISMPLLAPEFRMTFSGRLGPMPATAFAPFLTGATKVSFSAGQIESITYNARVQDGVARGTIVPRWKGLVVEVPGIAKKGFLSGVRRTLAKIAANEFMLNGDNTSGGKEPPENGVIHQRWTPQRTLPQFLWFSLRDGLLPILQK